MTSERNFDRLARAWLEQGPDEAPDRVVAAVLQAAETTPQVRRPVRWLPWRSLTMTPVRMGAAIAVVLVVLAGGVYLFGGNRSAVPPTPTASAAITPSPLAIATSLPLPTAAIADNLIAQWMGSSKATLPGIAVGSGTVLTFTKDSLALAQANAMTKALLSASAATGAEGQVVLGESNTCQPNEVGTYSYRLSAGDRHLVVALVSDPCVTRSATIPGAYDKTTCKLVSDLCLGDVSAGTHSSQYIDPRVKVGDTWAPRFGAITYTVPDGWANSADWPAELYLTPSVNFALETAGGPHAGAWYQVDVEAHPALNDPSVDCFKALTTIPQTVDAHIAHLVASPAITSTTPQSITIDGHAGQWIDITKNPAWTGTCGEGAAGAANVLIEAGSNPSWVMGPTNGEAMRVILIDLGGGDLVLILLDAGDGTKLAQLASQAMPIVDSLKFN